MSSKTITIQDFGTETIHVEIEGTSPLIMNKWTEKEMSRIREKHLGLASAPGKEARDPEAEYLARIYRTEDGAAGFPATAFKLAATRASTMFGHKMTEFRPMVFIHGDGSDQLVRIVGEPKMREDLVRVGGKGKGTGDPVPRWRPEFWPWSASLTITYATAALSAEQVVNIVNASGMNGIGEWRPEKDGTFGTFRVTGAEVAS